MPDPVKEALDRLMRRIEKLEETVGGLGEAKKGRAATTLKATGRNQ
jgi:hypothetical protein